MPDDLERLVHRLRSGIEREESARRLDAELRPRLQRYFQASGFPPAEAEDLVQQALIRVFHHVDGLREEERFLPWLFTVARNVGRTALRQRGRESLRREGDVDLETVAGEANPVGESEARERLARVDRALCALPTQQRRCLVMVVRDELSYQEVGDLLGVSPLTVRNHLAEARRRLRRAVDEEAVRT